MEFQQIIPVSLSHKEILGKSKSKRKSRDGLFWIQFPWENNQTFHKKSKRKSKLGNHPGQIWDSNIPMEQIGLEFALGNSLWIPTKQAVLGKADKEENPSGSKVFPPKSCFPKDSMDSRMKPGWNFPLRTFLSTCNFLGFSRKSSRGRGRILARSATG